MAALTPTQHSILRWLKRGWRYSQIAAHLGIRLDCVHVHAFQMRKKLGLPAKATVEQYREAYAREGISPYLMRKGPSKKQHEVLRLIAQGLSYAKIGIALRMGPQTVQNYASRACRRIGIIGAGLNRNHRVKEWWEKTHWKEDPMFQ
jgi:DNA-binding NarL/FixJ family response regulator